MLNKITGHAEVDICGAKYTIRFDWGCLAEISERFGEGPNMFNPDILAKIAAIGMKKYHPDMTADKIKEFSPPLVKFAKEVQEALHWAYFGPESIEQQEEKKNPTKIGFWRRIKFALGRVLTLSTSGI